MKSFVYGALVASVSAQVNFACVIPEGDDTWRMDAVKAESTPITDAASCKTYALSSLDNYYDAEDTSENKYYDICYHAKVKAAAEEGGEDTVVCESFLKDKMPEAGPDDEPVSAVEDIRVETGPKDGYVYTAWAWGAGEPLADLVATKTYDDADSAKMITSALAAVATIAMVAY